VTEDQAHQLLHGYRGGHGQIAASVKLTDRDSELITRLSDLSGSLSSGLRLDTYLTVYPLPSRRFFAAARTWPDPEAPRAGCVVTHTLLIPVEFWATFTNVRSVNGFFRNPHAAPEYDFSEPFDLLSEMDGLPLDNAEIDVTASKHLFPAISAEVCGLLFGSTLENLKSICGDSLSTYGRSSDVHFPAAHSVCSNGLLRKDLSIFFLHLPLYIRDSPNCPQSI